MKDNGPNPFVTNIAEATTSNDTFRTALWSGKYMQLTVMSIEPGDDVGMEVHEDHDQFLRLEAGQALVRMGESQDSLQEWTAGPGSAIFVPAGSWHNVVNSGDSPLKLYSIYAPPEHPHGTVHATKAEAEASEADH